MISTTDAAGSTIDVQTDGLGRPVTSYDYTLAGLLSSVTDPLGRVTSYTHDAGGRVTRVTEPDPDGAGPEASAYTDYVLDSLGNVIAQADALGNTHRVTLDAWFRVLTQSDPDDRLTQWDYDKLYRVTTETWRQTSSPSSIILRTFGYYYDRVGRLIEVADTDPLASEYAYMYDARGQLQIEMQQHRFLGKFIFLERDYDAVGNQTQLDVNIGGWAPGGVLSGGHSAFRNNYSYDRMDRLTSITQTERAGGHAVAPKHASFTYDAASQLTDLRRYASTGASSLQVHSRFGRDQAGRLTSITHGRTGIASGQHWDGSATPPASLGTAGLLAGYTFEYDQANRLNEMRSWADGTQTSFGYDDRSQLTAATTTAIVGMTPPFGLPGGEGYDFDAGGNRQGSGGTPQSATGTHNQLQTDGAYNYFYDGEGNLIRRESLSNFAATLYEWDHRNRLVSVKEAPFYQAGPIYQNMIARRIEYIYDAFDQRVGRRIEDTGGGSGGIWGIQWKRYEAYAWADGQEVLRFTDSDGVESAEPFRLANRYLWSNQVDQLLAEEQYTGNSGPAIDAPAAHSSAGETFWPLTDHLGSVRGLVDNNGVIRQHVSYDSFGNRLVEQHYDSAGAAVAASHAEAVDTLFGYTGRAWDSDTGLQYNRARWYDPSTGRWLSQDPIGFAAGDANLYRYVGNEVTGKTDPSGLQPPGGGWHPHGSPPPAMGSSGRRPPSKITIDGLIQGHLIGRIIQLGKLGSAGPNMFCIDRSNEFEAAFRADMNIILRRLAETYKNGPLPTGTIHVVIDNVRNPNNNGEWRWPSYGAFDTGWWLNGAHNVSAEIYFSVKEINGTLHMTNVRSRWTWKDEIDARGCQQWWNAKDNWTETWKGVPNLFIESIIWDKLVDGLLDADFKIQIQTPWTEDDYINTHVEWPRPNVAP